MRLLSPPTSNAKLDKTLRNTEFRSYSLVLAAARSAYDDLRRIMGSTLPKAWSACPDASAGCVFGCCVNNGGQGTMASVQRARIDKTVFFMTRREQFLQQLFEEIEKTHAKAQREGAQDYYRLGCNDSFGWWRFGIVQRLAGCSFYDYYPLIALYRSILEGNPLTDQIPANMRICWSRKETNTEDQVRTILGFGQNVAVVFHNGSEGETGYCGRGAYKQRLPESYLGFPVIDGDESDIRFLDPQGGYVVGLRLKSRTQAQRDLMIKRNFSLSADCR